MRRPSSRMRGVRASCLEIALVNNMPDAALEATERQFRALLESAAGRIRIRLTLYTLPEVPRSELARQHIDRSYCDIADLLDGRVDGLIVTGAEPRAASLTSEPYWRSLTTLLDWACEQSHSTVCSCLAAHAAVLHMDGVRRRPLGDKRFGIFDCTPAFEHPLTAALPARMRMPHSRWNELPEDALRACGYRVLTRSAEAGVDSFVKQNGSLFVFFQGHPEYEAETLLLEYRRDIKRYLRGERDTFPTMPFGYFDEQTIEMLKTLRERARSDQREELLAEFPVEAVAGNVSNTWRRAAVSIYRGWLGYICSQAPRALAAG